MAQTTSSVWGGAAYVEISVNGSVWTDISGHANQVTPAPTERRQGEAYTFDGEYPIVKVGKYNSTATDLRILYTEGASDAFEIVRGQFESPGGGTLYVRWSPRGVGGGFNFVTDAGFVKTFQYPPIDAEEDGPMQLSFTVQHSRVTIGTASAIASSSVSPSVSSTVPPSVSPSGA